MADSFQPKFIDLVRNFTDTHGTGDLVLGDSVPGFVSFTSALQPGDRFYYSMVGLVKTNESEVGRGTLQADGRIAREPINGEFTNFSTGKKAVSLVAAAEWFDAINSLRDAPAGASSRAELASLAVGGAAILSESGREGTFIFDASNLSAEVTADTLQGIYVAPDSDSTGASGAWVRHPGIDTWINAQWFGADEAGTAEATSASIIAAVAAAPAGGTVKLPRGNLKLKNGALAGLILATAGLSLVGEGREATKLVYTSTVAAIPAIKATADNVRVADLTIDATACSTDAGTGTAANCAGLKFEDVDHCSAEKVTVLGGHHGIAFHNTNNVAGDYTTNKHNRAEGCLTKNTASSGIHSARSFGLQLLNNVALHAGTDGIKCSEGTFGANITGNFCAYNDRDGIDTYDGFVASNLADNIAMYNGLQGFEVKGTFGGTYTAGDYVNRDSTISGNLAYGNGTTGNCPGFSWHGLRNCALNNNISIANTGDGFQLNDIQGCTGDGNLASKNQQHGLNCVASVSRTSLGTFTAVDNSWVDGTIQNGTYHGIRIASGCSIQVTGGSSLNGTIAGQKGGQGYGVYFDTGATGSVFDPFYTIGNVTGGFGGAAGFAANNKLFNVTNNGTFRGLSLTVDALDEIGGDLNINLVRAGNPEYKGSRTAGAGFSLLAQSALAALRTTTNHPLHLGTNNAGRVEVAAAGHFQPLSNNVLNNGGASNRWANLYAVNLRPGDGTPIWTSGAGTPEGVVTAVVGSLFTRTDGGAGTTLYVKESGTGNTGWAAK
ncbi:MAG TPA: hypothetical protein VMK31_07130 [Sphingomicrobium sp.]|nr:hypothetical protein [Sphingomicrobium sp.]